MLYFQDYFSTQNSLWISSNELLFRHVHPELIFSTFLLLSHCQEYHVINSRNELSYQIDGWISLFRGWIMVCSAQVRWVGVLSPLWCPLGCKNHQWSYDLMVLGPLAPPPVSCPPRLLTSLRPSVFGTSFDLFPSRFFGNLSSDPKQFTACFWHQAPTNFFRI